MLNERHVIQEIEKLQSQTEVNRELLDAKHLEWDRYKHMIDLFFEAIGM